MPHGPSGPRARSGPVLLGIGVLGALVNWSAMRAFPDRWGGPNIGAGLIQVAFYAAVVVGLVVTLRRRSRRSSTSDQGD